MNRILTFISLLALPVSASAQSSLHFQILDIHTDMPVVGVDVWVAGDADSVLAVTGPEGSVEFSNPNQYHRFRIHHLSYEERSGSIKPGDKYRRIYLAPRREELQEVVITGQSRPILAEEAVRQLTVINQ